MTFLQPWALVAFPLLALPILIHLFNRWRYQSQPWAATMFLLQAKSMASGMARLRQYLILAMRVAAIAALVLAISRPLASGVLSRLSGTTVDTTIVIWDRSASMDQRGIDTRETKLETCRRQLVETLAAHPAQNFVLVDSSQPAKWIEVGNLDALQRYLSTNATSVSADVPQMLETCLDFLTKQPIPNAEVWICSDQRKNDWRDQQSNWKTIREEFGQLASQVRFVVFSYPEKPRKDLAIRSLRTDVEERDGQSELLLDIEVIRADADSDRFEVPIEVEIRGARTTMRITGEAGVAKHKARLQLASDNVQRGWGRVSLPSDDNLSNNQDYFVFEQTIAPKALIVSDDADDLVAIQLACRITAEGNSPREVSLIPRSQFASVSLDQVAFVVWQGALPRDVEKQSLIDFLGEDGCVWLLPSEEMLTGAVGAEEFLGFHWLAPENATSKLQVTTWRAEEDLLASAASGSALPVGELSIAKSQLFAGPTTSLATLNTKGSLLAKIQVARGALYAWSTLPSSPHSNIAENGVVLFAAVQRSLSLGSRRLASIANFEAFSSANRLEKKGLPELSDWKWLARDERTRSDEIGSQSGVLEAATRMIAVHRSPAEDTPEGLDSASITKLFAGLDVVQVERFVGSKSPLQSEIWRALIAMMIVVLLVEAALSLPRLRRTPLEGSRDQKSLTSSRFPAR